MDDPVTAANRALEPLADLVADAQYEKALEIIDAVLQDLAESTAATAIVRAERASILLQVGNYEDAAAEASAAAAALESEDGARPYADGARLVALESLVFSGRPEDARREAHALLRSLDANAEEPIEARAMAHFMLALAEYALGRPDEALGNASIATRLADEVGLDAEIAVEIDRLQQIAEAPAQSVPPLHVILGAQRNDEALALLRRRVEHLWSSGRYQEAAAQQEGLVELLATTGQDAANDPELRGERIRLAQILRLVGLHQDAAAELKELRASLRKVLALPPSRVELVTAHVLHVTDELVELSLGRDAIEEVGALIRFLEDLRPEREPDRDALLSRSLAFRAGYHSHEGDAEKALADFDRAYAIHKRCASADERFSLDWRVHRAVLLANADRWEESAEDLGVVVAALSKDPDAGPLAEETIEAREYLAMTLTRIDIYAWLDEIGALIESLEGHPNFGPEHPRTLDLRARRTRGVLSLDSQERAEEPTDAMAISADRGLSDGSAQSIALLASRGTELIAFGRSLDGVISLEAAYDAALASSDVDEDEVMRIATILASGFTAIGRFQQAIDLQTDLIRAADAAAEAGADPDSEASACWRRAHLRAERSHALAGAGRLDEALADAAVALTEFRSTPELDFSGTQVLSAWSNYAAFLHRVGRFPEAIDQLRQAIAAREEDPQFGPLHPRTLIDRANLAVNLGSIDQHDEAVAVLDATIADYDKPSRFTLAPRDLLLARLKRATLLTARGDTRAADAEFQALIPQFVREVGPTNPWTSSCRVAAAAVRESLGDASSAFTLRLAAFAAMDRTRYTFTDANDRERWRADREDVLAPLLAAAVASGDARAVAEFIEAARTQGIPVDEAPSPAPTDLTIPPAAAPIQGAIRRWTPWDRRMLDSASSTVLGLDPVAPPPTIRVAGVSALEQALPPALQDERPTINIEDVVDQLAGLGESDVAWWGQWVADGWIFQSLLLREHGIWKLSPVQPCRWGPAPSASDGTESRAPHDTLATSVARWRRAMSQIVRGDPENSSGPLATCENELLTLYAIARVLIPDVLRERLLAIRPGDPLRMVIAPAPELADLPFAFLPLSHPMGEAWRVRIIDRALTTYSPSVAFSSAAGSRGATPTWPERVAASVVDPTGDLEFARPLPDAGVVLRRSEATRAAVIDVLASSTNGLVHIAAHAISASSKPADAALELTGGEQLRARDVMRINVQASVVLLACCASASPPRSAEWLGLGPAFLWAGAGAVVATLWAIADGPEAQCVESRLAEALCASGNGPVDAVRRVQLELLRDWRSGADRAVHPHHFAGYIALTRGRV